jgi:site-specific DNA-methyltransferase (adenine-specific)
MTVSWPDDMKNHSSYRSVRFNDFTKSMVQKSSRKFFLDADGLRILHDNFISTPAIPEQSIDLTVTSPPYSVDVKYGRYDDGIPYPKYLEFTRKWLEKCYGLTKMDGRLCLNIPLDKNKGGQQSVYADVETIARKVGWHYHTTIIWNEQNISRRTAWGSWLSASAPFVISPVEVILVMYKGTWKKTSGSRRSDISREDFMNWTNGFWDYDRRNEVESETNPVWSFNGESRKRLGHPAPFPVELPKRCIKLFSFVGDTILDPFLGSGSTLVAAGETNRQGVGVEIDEEYCRIARARLVQVVTSLRNISSGISTGHSK